MSIPRPQVDTAIASAGRADDEGAARWLPYRRHFERTALRPLPEVPPVLAPGAPAAWAAACARVLARFQLGEAGEGRVARDIYRIQLAGIDDHYRHALGLFVKEEGRHARILAALVRGLGGRLLAHGTSNQLFRWCRRLLGLRFKLVTLLVAEVVGGETYAALAARAPDPALGAALAEIAGDERHHLGFHVDFFRATVRALPARLACGAALWAVGLAALAVVLLENRRDLPPLALHPRDLAARVAATLRAAARAAFQRPRPALPAAAEVRS
jgi:hypothetical protein